MKKLVLLLLAALSVFANAHDPKLSGIGILFQESTVKFSVQAHLQSLDKLEPKADLLRRLSICSDGTSITFQNLKFKADSAEGIAYLTAETAGSVSAIKVDHRLFADDPDSRTIVTVVPRDASPFETLLDASHTDFEWNGESRQNRIGIAKQFLTLGITHIFSGPDHILFILGLILIGGRLRNLLRTVTAFTIAHSITLTVAATGIWNPSSKFVEPLIALSIVFVALENLRPKKDRTDYRPIIAFGFGLVHGFGFAGGVTEAGLPRDAMIWALAPFNIGVECAQAAIVLLVFPILVEIRKRSSEASSKVVLVGSICISLAGGAWFLQRVELSEVLRPSLTMLARDGQ